MFQIKRESVTWFQIVDKLTQNNALLTSALTDLTHEVEILRRKNEELADHIKKMNDIPTQFASGPLWMSEEEEDAHYRYEHGDINREMLHETLQELGLNPDITTD